MANNFDNNFTRKIAKGFLKGVESKRVLSKNVNTQLLDGKFNPASGADVDFKRGTDYTSIRTPKGDISGDTPSDIVVGKATGTVQDYFTVFVDYDEADEAIKMDELDKLLDPMTGRLVTDVEVDYAKFMLSGSGLTAGVTGTPVNSWEHVAEAGALMESIGIPKDGGWCYSINPFTQKALSKEQRSLGAGGSAGSLISEAHRNAIVAENFAGMKVMTATTLPTYQTFAGADRTGAVAANPVVTYDSVKNTMIQSIAVSGFVADLEIKAGETVTFDDVNMLNLSTRQPVIGENGNKIPFSSTVSEDVTLDGSGAGTILITGPAIYEAGGAYNTVDGAITTSTNVTLGGGGASSVIIQPNLFWHKEAFSIGSVPIKKLHSTDTLATTEDGLQFRVSKGVGFLENNQKVRIDFRPAYAKLNPFFAGKGFGR
ncbi:MAG: P22 phage major capsid protein family protein [Cellvibrionaceae bacterium]